MTFSWSRLDLPHVNFEHTGCSAFEATISRVHGARSTDVRAFAKHIKKTCDNIKAVLINAKPTDRNAKGVDYHKGRIDVEKRTQLLCLQSDTVYGEYGTCSGMKSMPVETMCKSLEQEVCRTENRVLIDYGIELAEQI